ncbi:nuclear body protein SP140-like protein isoform X1 [Silurus meridionalis]|uniref:nuclear body protein SP140-like protein isoform X1 n=1 Tax=Silurus meridionalis TaxID=175797 RepID=UPI001EEAC6CE|nr:nuclear body protein SP140-like protein isoform X1 [Silurus meridionalis]XP_046700241.1 nuclear body protein SP140-like protein isoform X1 [Silurus meridionalis]
MLCPDKFAKGEKCILTEGHWSTTGDFERISGKGGNKNWKLSIRYQNIPLLTLLKEGQLQYPVNAKADIRKVKKRKNLASCCVESPAFQHTTGAKSKPLNPPDLQLERVKDRKCFICNEEGKLVHCTECLHAFHHRCHLPPLKDQTPGGNWMCTFCVFKENQQFQNQAQREAVLNSPISENLTHCEYLLLCLYKGDELHVFTTNPNMEWSPVISEPMWLNKVKNKLEFNIYRTVEEFVNDIHLIFNNCRILNNDNEFGTIGAKLQRTFEREFQWIFNIK